MELKQALITESAERKLSLTDVAAGHIAAYFGTTVAGKGRPPTNVKLNDQVNLRLPIGVQQQLYGASRRWGLTQSSAAISILAMKYDIGYTPKKRGGAGRP